MLTSEASAPFDEKVSSLVSGADTVLCFLNGEHQADLSRSSHAFHVARSGGASVRILNLGATRMSTKIAVLHLYKGANAAALSLENTYVLEAGARAEIVELHQALDDSELQIQNRSLFTLAQGAELGLGQFSSQMGARLMNNSRLILSRDSKSEFLNLLAGGRENKHEFEIHLQDEGASVSLLSLAIGEGFARLQNSSHIAHEKGETQSLHVAKSIMRDSSQFVFDGRLVIYEDAQKSDASQYNHNLLLSDTAEVNTRPQLEVLADDVKAAHGATIGALQEEEVFYLQSRGLPREQAIQILVRGYAHDLIEKVSSPFVTLAARQFLAQRLL